MSPDAIEQLRSIALQEHFFPQAGTLYTGVKDPILRSSLEAKIDSAVAAFTELTQKGGPRSSYIALLSSQMSQIDRTRLDTEDAERVASAFEQIIDAVGLDSSDGVINNWMYGFDPNKPN